MEKILKLHQEFLASPEQVEKNLEVCHKNLLKIKDTNSTLCDLYELAKIQVRLITKKELEKNPLAGCVYTLKDNISTRDIITTGGSRFLNNYTPTFNAKVYDDLLIANAVCLAKANLDEFGLGGTGTFSAYGVVKNFYNKDCIAGGSSSGCANLVAAEAVNFAIGTDTGDSVRKPATFTGIVGFKPSYGLISRYGVFPYSPSLDHVGIMTKHVEDAVVVFENIIKTDYRDFTTQTLKYPISLQNFVAFDKKQPIALFANLIDFLEPQEKLSFKNTVTFLKENGFVINEIEFPNDLLSAIDLTYKIISYSEATSCYANITGITFGEKQTGNNYDELLFNNRTFGFGDQLKRRFVIGAYATSKEHSKDLLVKSQKIRHMIVAAAAEVFKNYQAIIFPGASSVAPLIKDVEDNNYHTNICDDALVIANLGGFPSISIPTGRVNHLPVGINLMCDAKQDQKLLELAIAIEKEVKYE